MRAAVVLVSVVLMVTSACGDDGDGDGGQQQGSASPVPTITVSPIDPAHVTAVSKFRSCSGHDFSPGVHGKGGPDTERARSMKHYLKTDVTLTPAGQVQILAPFDGTVDIQTETFDLGKQIYVTSGDWSARIFHIDPTVADGAEVKAGDVIGTIAPTNAVEMLGDHVGPNGEPTTYEFDIAVTSTDDREYVSMFDLMNPAVAARWAARGFTATNTLITRAERDAAPCELGPDGERFANQEEDPADWVSAA
ncbi:MAG TPA: peptidoglycan DD-metalloendopeptidase family protein [Ilumatobacteraceae bacterium]|nr:peptidoglycan DD-metalloendopeptidase family protein [Ilumatobacteraceae bacterium]